MNRACFGMIAVFSFESDRCCSCEQFEQCDQQVLAELEGLSDRVSVTTLMRKHRKLAEQQKQIRISKQSEFNHVESTVKPEPKVKQPKPSFRYEKSGCDLVAVEVDSTHLRICDYDSLTSCLESLRMSQNSFNDIRDIHFKIACDILLKSSFFTKKQLEFEIETSCNTSMQASKMMAKIVSAVMVDNQIVKLRGTKYEMAS